MSHYPDSDEMMQQYEAEIGKFIKMYVSIYHTNADFFIVGNKTSLIATAFSKEDAEFLAKAMAQSAAYQFVDVMSAEGLVMHIELSKTNNGLPIAVIDDLPDMARDESTFTETVVTEDVTKTGELDSDLEDDELDDSDDFQSEPYYGNDDDKRDTDEYEDDYVGPEQTGSEF